MSCGWKPRRSRARVDDFDFPRGMMVENTSACNLACTSCSRDLLRDARRRTRLRMDEIDEAAGILARHEMNALYYFKLGDPFASPSIRREREVIRERNPDIRIISSTNGILLESDDKREAAMLLDDLIFSIDGIDTESVRRCQRGGGFDRAYSSMRELLAYRNERRQSRPDIGWRYVVFRWNDSQEQVERGILLAREAGIDYLELVFAHTPFSGISLRRFYLP